MTVLAFDTCFGAVSVAVGRQTAGGEWATHEAYEEMAVGQAERLMPMMDEVLRAAGIDFSEVSRIAVTRGPGSFTGVRVGVAAARALALATGVPLVTTTSLAALAATADSQLTGRAGGDLVVAMDARRGGLYMQVFGTSAREEVTAAELATPEAGAMRLAGRRVIAVGSGAEALARAAAVAGSGQIEVRLPDLQPRAASLLMLAAELPPVEIVAPLYLRQPDAKPQVQTGPLRTD
ncbi:MAG: tRNA (adenosine(37)-N6)-threonylcarbamoyltransferase complex dimerization subunit type 1 TsaB [Hyphomicrobiaceae bacterium]